MLWISLSTLVSGYRSDLTKINANSFLVQACCRSLIVDTLPIPLQQAGSAWGMFRLALLNSDGILTLYSRPDVCDWPTH